MHYSTTWGFPGDSEVKNLPAVQEKQEMCVQSLEKEMATQTHSSILAWEISWTEEPGSVQSVGLLRVWHDWATNTILNTVAQEVFPVEVP